MAYIPGIDVSHWQGAINWPAVKAAGKRYVFIKASEGTTYVDTSFTANWRGAKDAGLLRGAYHFFRPLQDAMRQADLFCRTVSLEATDLPPVLDLEVNENLTAAKVIQRTEVWCREVQNRTGRRPILYSGIYFLNTFFQVPSGGPPAWSKDLVLWIANYLGPAATQPYMPKGWSKWTFWQHSASGKVNGISGNVDLDWFNGTPAELLALTAQGSVPGGQLYTVQPGDTLASIATQFQVSLEKLIQANPQLLHAGMTLNIPSS